MIRKSKRFLMVRQYGDEAIIDLYDIKYKNAVMGVVTDYSGDTHYAIIYNKPRLLPDGSEGTTFYFHEPKMEKIVKQLNAYINE